MSQIRVGSACVWLQHDGAKLQEISLRTTTVRYVSGLDEKTRTEFLYALVHHNLDALESQIQILAQQPRCLRMWRIGSDLLPLFTHAIAKPIYQQTVFRSIIQEKLKNIGYMARHHDIRLSFHPGQFVVLASQNPAIRTNSMRELKYHCDLFTAMGYSGWHDQGVAVNVHVGVKNAAVAEMRAALQSAPENVQNFITLENDEFSWGTTEIVDTFGDLVPVVLDVHHHWIHTGRRLQPNDPLVKRVADTWRGVQPKLHLAMSKPELCTDVKDPKLRLSELLRMGRTRAALRAHSDTAWHAHSINYASQFGWDIMYEGKNKNLGAREIVDHLGLKE